MEPNKKWLISDKIGQVSGILQLNERSKCILVLGHGAGAGMHHDFMAVLAQALYELDIGVVRYNFPYMEKGKRRPDFPAVAHLTISTVVQDMDNVTDLPILLSGKSFGGRMASQWVSKYNPPQVKGLVFYGFPLHGIGKDGTERAEHLNAISIPMLFLQGTRDKLARKDLIQKVSQQLDSAILKFIELGDHSFKVPKRSGRTHEDIIQDLATMTNEWIDRTILK